MKTLLITIAAIGSTVGAFKWAPDAWQGVKNNVNKEVVVLQQQDKRELRADMAEMKYFDTRTDELAKDCKTLADRLIRLQEKLNRVPASSVAHRQDLEEQIRETEQLLQQKQRMLDQAEDSDRDILLRLRQSIA